MTDRDIDTLARTLVGEARGEGMQGMEAVAAVIMNRVKAARRFIANNARYHPLFGDGSPAAACLARWQFSCWNQNDPNREYIEALDEGDRCFRDALFLARVAVAGDLVDHTNGATHYYARSMKQPPPWAAGKTPCAEIRNHLFFKDV